MEKTALTSPSKTKIDNGIYDNYGDKWYTADDDPIALLRHESKAKLPWVLDKIQQHFTKPETTTLLDVGCGGGFLSNALATHNYKVTGVDMSVESLNVAKRHDTTKTVTYLEADAYKLPFANESFDVITAMDFLEHVENPEQVIKEISRVLKPNGLFIFHTFNRNILAYIVVIKFVEWFIKNSPKNIHLLRMFIKPKELENYCLMNHIVVKDMTGIKPVFSTIPIKNFLTGLVPETMRFELTKSLLLSYMGYGIKQA